MSTQCDPLKAPFERSKPLERSILSALRLFARPAMVSEIAHIILQPASLVNARMTELWRDGKVRKAEMGHIVISSGPAKGRKRLSQKWELVTPASAELRSLGHGSPRRTG